MKKLINKIYNLWFLFFAMLITAGCKGGGGGGGATGFIGDAVGSGSSFASGSSGVSTAGTTVVSYANPEPSSLLLLGSGLIGMAIYAKTRLKSKSKK